MVKISFVVSWRDSESSLELHGESDCTTAGAQCLAHTVRADTSAHSQRKAMKDASLCSTWWFLYQLCSILLLLKKYRWCLNVAAAENITSRIRSCAATAVIISSWCLNLHLKSHDTEVIRILGEVEKKSTETKTCKSFVVSTCKTLLTLLTGKIFGESQISQEILMLRRSSPI